MHQLDGVQKEILEPSNQTENLKHNMSAELTRHHQHLQDVQEFLNTANNCTNHTEHLLINIHTNLEEYKVSILMIELMIWRLFKCLAVYSDGVLNNAKDKCIENVTLSWKLKIHQSFNRY